MRGSGSYKGTSVVYFRSGYRIGTNLRSRVAEHIGFRLNGVRRGGTGIVSVTMFQANRVRCGSRYTRQFSGDSSLIGFRLGCEWCL